MARTLERTQNPTASDTVNLRLLVLNSNNFHDLESITNVKIYYLDSDEISEDNPDGRRLIQTIDPDDISHENPGQYLAQVELTSPLYVIGNYLDIWTVSFEGDEAASATIEQKFQIYPDLWFTTPIPIVHDFNFTFRPNRIAKGSKRYIAIEITPNVPRGTDLTSFYENLAIIAELRVSLEMLCGDCVPAEADLRLILDRYQVEFREKRMGYLYIDTTDLDIGMYDIWFELTQGNSVFISDKNNLQIY